MSNEIFESFLKKVFSFFEEDNRSLERPRFLFRGMKEGVPLCASISEMKEIECPYKADKAMFELFKKKIMKSPFYKEKESLLGENDWDLISLARHYGLSNRYLDWTSDWRVALWFAIHTWKKGLPSLATSDEQSVIWVLKTEEVDFVEIKNNSSPFPQRRDGKTKIFKTKNGIRRVDNQCSFMMRQVYVYKDGVRTCNSRDLFLEDVDKNPTFTGRVRKIKIDSLDVKLLDKYLQEQKINYDYLFPDEEELESEEIRKIVEECKQEYLSKK